MSGIDPTKAPAPKKEEQESVIKPDNRNEFQKWLSYPARDKFEIAMDLVRKAVDYVPVVGDVKAAGDFATGKESGPAAAFAMAVGFIPGGDLVKGPVKNLVKNFLRDEAPAFFRAAERVVPRALEGAYTEGAESTAKRAFNTSVRNFDNIPPQAREEIADKIANTVISAIGRTGTTAKELSDPKTAVAMKDILREAVLDPTNKSLSERARTTLANLAKAAPAEFDNLLSETVRVLAKK